MARLLPKDHPWLTSPDAAPYILSRTMNDNAHVGGLYMRLFTAETVNEKEIISVNGVGDTFLGALVAGLAKGIDYDERLIKIAQKAAVMTLKSAEAVSPDLGQLTAELESISSN
jgi:pseudouridine-5'-phosphate glycosidase/pseudouridine kinase